MKFVIEAYPNVDMVYMSYFAIDFDADFFEAIQETMSDIKIEDVLSFKMSKMFLISAHYHTIRKIFKVKDVESEKYTFEVKNFTITPKHLLQEAKIHIDNESFYFSGINNGILFTSLSFNKYRLKKILAQSNKELVASGI